MAITESLIEEATLQWFIVTGCLVGAFWREKHKDVAQCPQKVERSRAELRGVAHT